MEAQDVDPDVRAGRESLRQCGRAGEGRWEVKGRKPTARAKSNDVLELHRKDVKPQEIANQVGIGRASVYRILNDEKIDA